MSEQTIFKEATLLYKNSLFESSLNLAFLLNNSTNNSIALNSLILVADCLSQLNQFSRSIHYYDLAIRLVTTVDLSLREKVALCYYLNKDFDKAKREFELIDDSKKSARSLNACAVIYEDCGSVKLAVEKYKLICNRFPYAIDSRYLESRSECRFYKNIDHGFLSKYKSSV